MSQHMHPVLFVGAGPGDAEQLTLRAVRALAEADVVLHDRLVSPEVRALIAGRAVDVGKEGFGRHTPQDVINARIVEEARAGHRVVRLKAGDPTVFGRLDEELDAVTDAGLSFEIVPGVTSASAAVASIGQSLTKRGRNTTARFVTGHDMKGYAEQEWRALAAPGQVAAIYMGKRAARFLQGRLTMFGADPATPITVVENASRPTERRLATSLSALSSDLTAAGFDGPAIMLLGLAPRDAAALSLPTTPRQEEFA